MKNLEPMREGGEQDAGWLRASFWLYKRLISPVLHGISSIISPVPTGCRFQPTCSEYAYVALHRHGIIRGGWLALWRLLRCHPFSRGGLDPVPLTAEQKLQAQVQKAMEGPGSSGVHTQSGPSHLP